ncbi:MAG TPA: hypothetical protein VFB74_13240 [Kribbellaceae bacterium]|nr:hypothetical protein [Kribbellaceae bacterium]
MFGLLYCIAPARWKESRGPWPGVIIIIVLLAFAGWMVNRGNDLGDVVSAIVAMVAAAAELIRLLASVSSPAPALAPGGPAESVATERFAVQEGR